MQIPSTPDRSGETIPEEWTDEYDNCNDVAQAYIDWMNGKISKSEYMEIKYES